MKLSEAELVVFETPLRENFYPLSLTKPTFDFLNGSKTLLERIELSLESRISELIVPDYLVEVTTESHEGVRVNKEIARPTIAVNSLISGRLDLKEEIEQVCSNYKQNILVVDSSKEIVFAVLDELRPHLLASRSRSLKTFDGKVIAKKDLNWLMKYPWDLISQNSVALNEDYQEMDRKKVRFEDLSSKCEIMGKTVKIARSAEVGRYVTFDARNGPIIVDENAEIQSFSHLSGPCYIGRKTQVKSAKIRRGTSIGQRCKVAGEVEETIVSDFTNKSHEGYIGHSYIGSWVNLGAGTTNSDLKNTYGEIKMIMNGQMKETGANKLGVFVGDMSKTAIGTMILSGKTVGVSSLIFGSISQNVPSFTLFDGFNRDEAREMYFESAVEVQRRMMARREVRLTPSYERMMSYVFKMTSEERRKLGVQKGKFKKNQ